MTTLQEKDTTTNAAADTDKAVYDANHSSSRARREAAYDAAVLRDLAADREAAAREE